MAPGAGALLWLEPPLLEAPDKALTAYLSAAAAPRFNPLSSFSFTQLDLKE